jgi:hypothetical protein
MSNSVPTYADLIARLRAELPDGHSRFSPIPVDFLRTWWPSQDEPSTFVEGLNSDYGQETGPPEVTAAYDAEVKAIRECMASLDPNELKDDDPSSRVNRQVNRIAQAISFWEEIAFPIRRIGDRVYRIIAPRDALNGRPIVKEMSADDYIRGSTAISAVNRAELIKLKEQVGFYKRWMWILGGALVMVIVWSSAKLVSI